MHKRGLSFTRQCANVVRGQTLGSTSGDDTLRCNRANHKIRGDYQPITVSNHHVAIYSCESLSQDAVISAAEREKDAHAQAYYV